MVYGGVKEGHIANCSPRTDSHGISAIPDRGKIAPARDSYRAVRDRPGESTCMNTCTYVLCEILICVNPRIEGTVEGKHR